MHAATDSQQSPEERIAQLEAERAELLGRVTTLEAAQSQLTERLEAMRARYQRLMEQMQLAQRRLFLAKAERSVTEGAPEQLAFDKLFEKVKTLRKKLDEAEGHPTSSTDDDDNDKGKPDGRRNRKVPPTGRRDLSELSLPVVRIEVTDPELEGKAPRIGFKESSLLGFQRGGQVRVVTAVAVYRLEADSSEATTPGTDTSSSDDAPSARIVTAKAPLPLVTRGILAPSMIAHLLSQKYLMGMPFHRLEQQLRWEGQATIDRGTMCRYAEEIGATVGAIVEACRKEAIASAFCLSTDATGASIQPTPLGDKTQQPCRKAHFFVTLADRDHVFFDYQPKHNGLAVWEMFRGYCGYIQADAHAIYDALFRGTPPDGAEEESDASRGPPPTEVGCWSHARRKFWEAAVCKHPLGVDGLRRINAIFEMERSLADMPPVKRKQRRDAILRPLVDDFFAWVTERNAEVTARGLVASALGYANRQQAPLRRFLDDGRLPLDNNRAERELRTIAIGRNAWLFFGSDDHANAAANLYSLFASCKLHNLDPQRYLFEILRVLPYWPRDRYLELAPKYWQRTRDRLDPAQLEAQAGHVTIPARPTSEQQPASS